MLGGGEWIIGMNCQGGGGGEQRDKQALADSESEREADRQTDRERERETEAGRQAGRQ